MTSRERFVRTLTGQPVDRVPFIKVFGGTNAVLPHWKTEQPGLENEIDRILGFEGTYRGWATTPVNFWFSQCGEPEKIAENASEITLRYTEGTVRIITKSEADFHGQIVEWPVKSRPDWLRVRDRHLRAEDPARFPPDWTARVQEYRSREYPLQLTHGGVYGFARNLMGDVNLAYAFYDEPDLVHEIMDGYTDMILQIWEKMVTEVEFDLVEFWEDMASKNGSLISQSVFHEFMAPNYRKVAAFARKHRIPIILTDSDGLTEDLAGWMMEAGLTAMYPFEVGAGNDLDRTRKRYPTLGIIGGLEKNAMALGKEAVDAEMEKARRMIRRDRFIPGPDHMALTNVTWPQYRYFMERLKEVVMTTQPEG